MNTEALVIIALGGIAAYFFMQGTEGMEETVTWDDLINSNANPPPNGMSYETFKMLIRAVIQVESNWNPNAVSTAGAIGLMQVMPANAIAFGYDPQQLYQPSINILLGVRILRDEINKFGIRDGLAAYNGGPSKRHIVQTQAYASKVLGVAGFTA